MDARNAKFKPGLKFDRLEGLDYEVKRNYGVKNTASLRKLGEEVSHNLNKLKRVPQQERNKRHERRIIRLENQLSLCIRIIEAIVDRGEKLKY
jgi:hypothetical protein